MQATLRCVALSAALIVTMMLAGCGDILGFKDFTYPTDDSGSAQRTPDSSMGEETDATVTSDAATTDDTTAPDGTTADVEAVDAGADAAGCNAATCPDGCCDSNDHCADGTTSASCGKGGEQCSTCATGQSCENQVCSCGGSCTTGCCTSTGACVTSAFGSCGAPGVACKTCVAGQECNASGACVCDATSCPDGCCNGSTCVPYASQGTGTCGTGGAACTRLRQRTGLQRGRRLHLHADLVPERVLPGGHVPCAGERDGDRLRLRRQRLRHVRHRPGLHCGSLQLRRGRVQRVLQQRRVQDHLEPDVRRRRRVVHDVRQHAGVQRRQVRLRRGLVSERLLRLERAVPRVGHWVVRDGRRGVRRLQRDAGVQRRQVRLRRDLLPERLLQRNDLRAVRLGDRGHVRRGRRRLRRLRDGPALQQRRQVRLRRDLLPERLLRLVGQLPDLLQPDLRHGGRGLREVRLGDRVQRQRLGLRL